MSIRVENLCKSYDGAPVLEHVAFTAEPGRITCLMAPSGFGKTSLLRVLLGLERPDEGTVSTPESCRWSAVFQEDRLLPQLSAEGNLRFVLGGAYDAAAAEALLAPVDALVLDEPFTGLDEENRAAAWRCIREKTAGKPGILVTHDVADAAGEDCVLIRL